jgi:serine/threonine protein kinase/tetratricopeptide (TPR) repeat protein
MTAEKNHSPALDQTLIGDVNPSQTNPVTGETQSPGAAAVAGDQPTIIPSVGDTAADGLPVTLIAHASEPLSSPTPTPPGIAATLIAPQAAATGNSEPGFELSPTIIGDGNTAQPRASGSSTNTALRIGNYEVLGELGRGGMGVVYKARHLTLNRLVAIKMILGGASAGRDAQQRFMAEARAVAKLQHPGIVQVFDIGEHEGRPWFSLEFVPGTDLQKELVRRPRNAIEAASIVQQLCISMQYAHERGILHRDLKPANVLIGEDGTYKITDFGLAREIDREGSTRTNEGTIMGSPSYMPPEQARGELSRVDVRSDVYSLGAVLYQILTGRPPFLTDRPLETVMQVIHNDPVAPRQMQPAIPVDLETICLKALQKEQATRYQTCRELQEDLQRFLNGEPILARPVSRLERTVRWCRRNPAVAASSSAALLLLVAVAVISTVAWFTTSAQANQIRIEKENVTEQRDEANRQRILANEAQLKAEKSQLLAEGQAQLALENIQYIVTDVDEDLAKRPGMAELRISILLALEKRWADLDLKLVGGIRGQAIPTLMAIQYRIVTAWLSLEKLQEADVACEKLYRIAHERMEIKGRLDATRYNLATICQQWAGIRLRLKADPAETRRILSEAIALLREIRSKPLRDPTDTTPPPKPFEIASQLQSALLQLAATEQKAGRADEAGTIFSEVRTDADQILAEVDKGAGGTEGMEQAKVAAVRNYFRTNRDLAVSGEANLLVRTGRIDEAIPMYNSMIESRRAALQAAPQDSNALDQMIRQLANFGQYLMRAGRYEDAATTLAEAVVLGEQAVALDPELVPARRLLATAQYYLATCRKLLQQNDEATALYERSRLNRETILTAGTSVAAQVDLMLSLGQLGMQEECDALIRELSASDVKNADLRIDIARALTLLAATAPTPEMTQSRREQAFAELRKAVNEGLSDPWLIETQADFQFLKGTPEFAEILASISAPKDKPPQ